MLDYLDTSLDPEKWRAASSLKMFAAVVDLRWEKALQFGPFASLRHNYRKPLVAHTLDWQVRHPPTRSNNVVLDQFFDIVGFHHLNGWFCKAGLPKRNQPLQRHTGAKAC
jgi:hypothetical protein